MKLFRTDPKVLQFEPWIQDSGPPIPTPMYNVSLDDEVVVPDQTYLNPCPVTIQFSKVEFSAGKKKILDINVPCEIAPGEVLAIIGSSGSGKTTLLRILAGRQGKFKGDVKYNGQPLDNTIKRLTAVVTQDDILLKNLTVKESLEFTARLSIKDKPKAKAAKVLKELGIEHCKNTRIGAIGDNNVISGGERKRTSVGMELLSDPSILFLDEPTSGLDAKTSLNLIDTIVKLASDYRTVILTIHQPRTDIFDKFNKLLILSKGKVCYFGDKEGVLPYFSSLGYDCPQFFNPADFLIDQISEAEEKTNRIISQFENLPKAPLQDRAKKMDIPQVYTPPYFKQIWILFQRSFITFVRDRALFLARIVQTAAMSLLVGLIYLGGGNNQAAIQNITGAMFFILIQQGMAPLFSTLNTFHIEKKVFLKEHESKQYKLSTYFIGKSCAEIPALMLFPIIFGVICYFMVGFQVRADRFFQFLLILVLIGLNANSMGLIISAMSPTLDIATLIAPFIITLFILFSGFYMNVKTIPVYFSWISYISFFRYGFEVLCINEFSGRTFTCDPPELVNGVCPVTSGDFILQRLGFTSPMWQSIGILIGMIFAYRFFAYVCLLILVKSRR